MKKFLKHLKENQELFIKSFNLFFLDLKNELVQKIFGSQLIKHSTLEERKEN